jgi:ELWxxDGT repeat protein
MAHLSFHAGFAMSVGSWSLTVLLLSLPLSASEPYLVRDIDETPGSSAIVLSVLDGAGDRLFFRTGTMVQGLGLNHCCEELWVTDGTTGGTKILAAGSDLLGMVWAIDLLFFKLADADRGSELWVSDGTPEGTRLLKDIYPGVESSDPRDFLVSADRIFFTARTPDDPKSRWASDGTAEGTVRVDEVPAGGSIPGGGGSPRFFVGEDLEHGRELWITDGSGVTRLLKDIFPGPGSSDPELLPFGREEGDKLFFVATDPEHGREPWVSDGTPEGTKLLLDIAGTGDSFSEVFPRAGAVGGRLLFFAEDGLDGRRIWASDGTSAGTSPFPEIEFDPDRPFSNVDLGGMATAGGRLFFWLFHEEWELWASDGTPEGTRLLATSWGSSSVGLPLWGLGDRAFFPLEDESGPGLGVSDGTPEGTLRLNAGGMPSSIEAAGERVFFSCGAGGELWITDGTPKGTARVSGVSSASGLTAFGDRIFFRASKPESGAELWVSNGTRWGSSLVKDIFPGQGSSLTSDVLIVLNGRVFFAAADPDHGQELWVSDGTAGGTRLVEDIVPGSSGSDPRLLAAMGGRLLFSAMDGGELWTSDGTPQGTRILKDIVPGTGPASLDRIAVMGGRLFFRSGDLQGGPSLWASDGTPEGTTLLGEIGHDLPVSGNGIQEFPWFAAHGDRLFFAGRDAEHGRELWVTDGTPEGTRLVKDIVPGMGWSHPMGLRIARDRLFFFARDAEHGYEPWAMDLSDLGGLQRPGDGNRDGRLDLSDAVWLLDHLFLGTKGALPCEGGTASEPGPGDLATIDMNGDGAIDISDAVGILDFLFRGGRRPALGNWCVRIPGCPDRCEP